MPTRDERLALGFLAAVALAVACVRAIGVQRFEAEARHATGPVPDSTLAARALSRQIAAVDSARRTPRTPRAKGARSRRARAAEPSSAAGRAPTLSREAPRRLDVNAATAQELERLPRVGPALAQRIVEWRERHGPFNGADDLRHVRGIGPATVRLLDTLVTFSGRHSPLDSEGPPSPDYSIDAVY